MYVTVAIFTIYVISIAFSITSATVTFTFAMNSELKRLAINF